jgi:sugar/nucleoside kinase (ribokinase family)
MLLTLRTHAHLQATAVGAPGADAVLAQVFVSPAAGLPSDLVVDTTGAGDSFIGSVIYGLVTGMAVDRLMRLGAVVAACKCTALGARQGLPRRQQLTAELLGAQR